MSIKKISLGIALMAIIMMPLMPASAATTNVLPGGNSIGTAFLLNRLFQGDKLLNPSGATLGNLFLLDQLFAQPTVTAAAATTTATTTKTTTTKVTPLTVAERMQGKIVLQVQDKGQAWYVNPATDQRTFLGPKPQDAFNAMARLALGVSNSNFASFGGTASSNLAGRFLIKPQDSGKLYYVNPTTLSITSIPNAAAALNLINTVGIGISNSDLSKISVAQ